MSLGSDGGVMMTDTIKKPSRGYTKLQTTGNIVAAWVALAASIYLGRDMAAIVVPIMATLIAALAGVYQTIGHFDLRAITQLTNPARRNKANRPRVDPAEVQQ